MTKRLIKMVAAAALLAPVLASAQSQVEVVNGERGMIFNDTPSTLTRDEVRVQAGSDRTRGDAHWRYAGGEAGWKHNDPSITFKNGQLVHSSDCPYVATLNAPRSAPGGKPVYTGA